MKEDFLKKLEEELNKTNAKNIDSILKKYEARYDFGLESDLSEEEIENMLGNPKDIASKYGKEKKETNKKGNISIKTVNDNIVVEKSNDDKIHILFDEIDFSLYNDYKTCIDEEGVRFEFFKTKYFGLNRKSAGEITLQIPEDREFDNVLISTQCGDIKIDSINSGKVDIITQSGDVAIKAIKSENFKIHTVSGDLLCYKIYSNKASISNVSGDIVINKLDSTELKVDTISGDVIIRDTNATYKTSSISGDVMINGMKCGSFKDNIKGVFRRK